MPIKSYLVHPNLGKKQLLHTALSQMEQCEVIPAENENLLILVTETQNKTEEENLQERLSLLKDIKLMALVSGFNTPKTF